MQPSNTDPNQPAANPAPNAQPTGRMIQPLSSEDDIRKEAEAARPEQTPSSQTTNQASAPQDISDPGYGNVYDQNTLTTEPLHHSPQTLQPQLRTSTLDQPPQDNKKGKGIAVLIGVIIIAALAAGAYFFLFNNKVTVADLVQETFQQTTYKRPKQWHATGMDGGVFGDLKAKDGKSSSLMSVKESQQASPLAGASDAAYDQLRTQLISQSSVASIEPALRNSSETCKSDIKFKIEQDTKKTETAIGLTTMTGTCTRDDGDFTVKIHTVAGASDGRIRVIALGARNVDWDQNSEAFQAILDGIGQVK